MSELELKDEIESLKAELSRLRRDVVDAACAVKDAGKSGAGVFRAVLDEKAREPVERTLAAARQKAQEGLRRAAAKLESRPVLTLLIAFGVGLVAGKVLERR